MTLVLKWDKCTLAVIINDFKTVWENLETLFLSWVIFNKIFSLEKSRHNFVKNEISQERNINLKKLFFSRPLGFKLTKEVLQFNDVYTGWSPTKTDLETKFSNLENWECQFLSVETLSADIWYSFFVNLFISVIDLIKHPLKKHRCKSKIYF